MSNSSQNATKTEKSTKTQADIEEKLLQNFSTLEKSNITTLAYYLYKNPSKWAEETFAADVNKLMPEAFAYNMKPSNALFGAIIAISVMLLIGLIWWVVTIFIKKNNKNVLNDPSVVNPAFI